jgi:hypothetical protein
MSWWTTIVADATNLVTNFNQQNLDQLIADIQQDVQVAESDLAKAGAWFVANLPTVISDAQEFIAVLSALTGNLTIPASVITVLETAVSDTQQFLSAVESVSSGTAHAVDVFATMGAVDDTTRIALGYKMHQSLISATAAARVALAASTKK